MHLLVIPEHHLDTFRDIGELSPDETAADARFVAETAREAGLEDYKVQVNVGAGGRPDGLPPALAHPRRTQPLEPSGAARRDVGERAVSLIAAHRGRASRPRCSRGTPTRRDALRLILSSLRSAEKDLQRPLSEDEELQVLQRERKRRIEASEAFRAAGREAQAGEGGRGARRSCEEFMPAQLTEEELERIVDDAIAETGATNIRDMGRVMADVMPQIAGRADGSAVSQLVREKLA